MLVWCGVERDNPARAFARDFARRDWEGRKNEGSSAHPSRQAGTWWANQDSRVRRKGTNSGIKSRWANQRAKGMAGETIPSGDDLNSRHGR